MLRARVRSEANLAGLQPPPDMSSLTPGLDLVIKHVTGMECEAVRQLAVREVTVLEAVSEKSYVPICHCPFHSEEAEEGSVVAFHIANLLIGLGCGCNHKIGWHVSAQVREGPCQASGRESGCGSSLFTLHAVLLRSWTTCTRTGATGRSSQTTSRCPRGENKVSMKLIDFVGSRLQSEDDQLNGSFSLPQAVPQLLCYFGGRVMVGMVDEANDMWAAATVLFQLLMSGYPEWESKFGLFMFGLTDAALVTANRLPDRGQKWQENMRGKIMTELWAALCLQPTKFDLPRTAASHTQSGSGAVIQYTRPVHKLLQLTDRNATSTDSGNNNCYRDAQPQMATRCFQSASAQMSCLVLSRLAG